MPTLQDPEIPDPAFYMGVAQRQFPGGESMPYIGVTKLDLEFLMIAWKMHVMSNEIMRVDDPEVQNALNEVLNSINSSLVAFGDLVSELEFIVPGAPLPG